MKDRTRDRLAFWVGFVGGEVCMLGNQAARGMLIETVKRNKRRHTRGASSPLPLILASAIFMMAINQLATIREAKAVVITAGLHDNFASPPEPAVSSAAFKKTFANQFPATDGPTNGYRDFDVSGFDSLVAHTFTGLPGVISSAVLSLHIRGTGTISQGIETEFIYLSFVDNPDAKFFDVFSYARSFGMYPGDPSDARFPADPGLLKLTPWATGDDFTFSLNLAALPLVGGGVLNLIPNLETKGFLDVAIGDETMVDFIRLEINKVPEPSTLAIFGLGLVGLGFMRRRRKLN